MISDVAASQFMTSFYAHWLNDKDLPDKAEALRRAGGDLRKRAGGAKLREWAGFELSGGL
jgi:CHAT domain-containing protein